MKNLAIIEKKYGFYFLHDFRLKCSWTKIFLQFSFMDPLFDTASSSLISEKQGSSKEMSIITVILILAIAIFAIVVLLDWLQRNSAYISWRTAKTLPGPKGLPFFGCSFEIAKLNRKYKNFEIFEHFCKKYGSIVGLQIGLQYTVVIEDFETAKYVLSSEDWQARNPEYTAFLDITFGKQVGLMFAYSEGWKENRKFVLKTLKEVGFGLKNKLDLYLTDEVHHLYKTLDSAIEQSLKQPEGDICMHRIFKLASLNILWRMLCGTRCSEDDEFIKYMIGRVEDTVQSMPVGCELQYAFPFLSKIPGLTSQKYQIEGITMLHDFFRSIIEERRESGEFRTNPNDFIGFYLQKIESTSTKDSQNPVFNDEQLIQSCSDMFLAGADTTGNSLEYAVLYMLKFPNVQKKVQDEIDAALSNNPEHILSYSDAERTPFTQAVLLEGMRHATITPIIPRTSIVHTKLNDCFIPKNTVALINFYKINHCEKTFGDPYVFRPERFLDSNGNLLKDSSTRFLQFGLGRRICVGMPMAKASFYTYFTSFFSRYTVEPSSRQPHVSLYSSVTGINNQPQPYYCKIKLRRK